MARLTAQEIRAIRERAGLNVPELAAFLGVASQNIVLWENEHEAILPEPWVDDRLRELAAQVEATAEPADAPGVAVDGDSRPHPTVGMPARADWRDPQPRPATE